MLPDNADNRVLTKELLYTGVTRAKESVILLAKEVNGKGYNYAYMENPEACIGCSNCAIVCPDGVISVYKVKIAG